MIGGGIMYLGNFTDYFVNIALAGTAGICMFWGFVLIATSEKRNRFMNSVALLGVSLIFSCAYLTIVSVSTGVMIDFASRQMTSIARTILFLDFMLKTFLTWRFFWKRRGEAIHEIMKSYTHPKVM